MMRRPTRRCFGEGSQRPGSERREHRASAPGYGRQPVCQRETEATREALSVACTRQPDSREGQAGPVRVAERPVVPGKPGNAGGGKGPQFESEAGRGTGPLETGASLLAPEKVRRLQRASPAQAKEDPDHRAQQWPGELARAVDAPADQRLSQWLCRKHQAKSGHPVRYPSERLRIDFGLVRLPVRTASFPWAKAGSRPRAGCWKSARPVR